MQQKPQEGVGCQLMLAGLAALMFAAGVGLYFVTAKDTGGIAPGEAPTTARTITPPAPTEPELSPFTAEDPPPEPTPAAALATTQRDIDRATGPSSSAPPEELLRELEDAYRRKLANPEWVAMKNRPGIPQDIEQYPEERDIRRIRARLAAACAPPPRINPLNVPRVPANSLSMEGRLRQEEWGASRAIPLGKDAQLFVATDGRRILLGVDAPGDTTAKGFDQFRFYFHVGLSPLIVNERVHVGTNPMDVSVLRETKVQWRGAPAQNEDERWKRYGITDWNVQALAAGASTVVPHRQYEASLDLEEAGLPLGVAFPVFVEVEGDPVYENGKFVRRVHVGELGSQRTPVWLLIEVE